MSCITIVQLVVGIDPEAFSLELSHICKVAWNVAENWFVWHYV